MYYTLVPSPLGDILLSGDDSALTGLWLPTQQAFARIPADAARQESPVFEQTRRWLKIYFEGRKPGFTPPLRPQGSSFRQRVWQELLQIPYGTTVTYGQLARRVVCGSARAVGGACGSNPISVIIPCHRVLAASGLGGYGGGLETKTFLLKLEHALPANNRPASDGRT